MRKNPSPTKPPRSAQPTPDVDSTKVRRAQNSVSLLPNQWSALDRLGELTRWGRNGAVEEAVELLLLLPPNAIQHLALLRRTQMRAIFKRRFHAAVQEALRAAEAQYGAQENPWAAYDAALETLLDAPSVASASERNEEELAALAVREVAAHRRKAPAAGGTRGR